MREIQVRSLALELYDIVFQLLDSAAHHGFQVLDLLSQESIIVLDFCVELIPVLLQLAGFMMIPSCLQNPLFLDDDFVEFPLDFLLLALDVHVSIFHLLHLLN
jgi:hypothetical protein